MSTEELGPRQRAAATKRARTQRAILTAASKLFDERGYHGVKVDAVAAKADVSAPTVYNHFPTKRVLAVAAYAPEVLAFMASTEAEFASQTKPETVLEDFIQELAAHLVAHPAMAYALLPLSRDVRSPDDESILAVNVRDLTRLVTTMLDYRHNEDDTEFVLSGLMTWIVQHPERSSEDAANLLLARFL